MKISLQYQRIKEIRYKIITMKDAVSTARQKGKYWIRKKEGKIGKNIEGKIEGKK